MSNKSNFETVGRFFVELGDDYCDNFIWILNSFGRNKSDILGHYDRRIY